MPGKLELRTTARAYEDLFTPRVVEALEALAPLNADRRAVMAARIARRHDRIENRKRIVFLSPDSVIPRTSIRVRDAREGNFAGSEIPRDLQRQWIQGTGPATKPRASVESGLRNVAYALLSGADGWMFDGEDALGQVQTMSLDNQRNLKLAIARDTGLPGSGRGRGGRDEPLGRGLLRPAHHRRLARTARLHDEDLPLPGPAPGRPPRPRRRRIGLLGLHRRPRPLRGQ